MTPASLDLATLERELRARIRGDVLLDAVSRGMYATDASNYQIVPAAVVVPRDDDDVRAAVAIARRHRLPILPRGAGTSLAGQTVAAAVVIDFSKHMIGILELDIGARTARVQPGLVRDELNAVLARHGLHFAPDPATGSRANVGGMIGNNSSGARSILYGKTIDHVTALKVLLADGTEMMLHELHGRDIQERARGDGREARILRGLRRIVHDNRDEIAARYPKVMRRVGGYALDELTDVDRFNPAKIMVGSEGTLGLVLEATLNLEPLPRHTSLCVVHFDDLLDAMRAVRHILPFRPSAVEILDHVILRLARENREAAQRIDFLQGDPQSVLLVEFYGDTADDVAARAHAVAARLSELGLGYAAPVMLAAAAQARVWDVRKSGLGLMLGMKGDRKPLPFIEDAAVPIAVLPEYIERVLATCRELDTDVSMYAHASVGLIHVRPILDLRRHDDIERMKTIADRVFELVVQYGGAWSGEHGDGLVRSPFNERFFGQQLYAAFKQVKALFDPDGLMNPGKIVDAAPMDANLRFGTRYRVDPPATVFKYRGDGSFAAAVDMCSGVGQCRKTLGGTMCPSYMATRDEEHSTRGRANALRLAMSGQLGVDALTAPRMREVLDLCLSCKACKTECPSNVDMAKLKSEVLQQMHDRHGASRRDCLVRDSAALSRRLAGRWAPAINTVQRNGLVRRLIEATIGFDHRRTLPAYATESLRAWMTQRDRRENDRGSGRRQVALFADTYLDCHEPHVGRAAVELLESCGYEVLLADAGCCQRPRISHGFLRDARRDGGATLRSLDALIARGIDVVVCEPSCASAITDDLPDLIDDAALGERVAGGVLMLDVFLERELSAGRLHCDFELHPRIATAGQRLMIHGHCHQKALTGTAAMKAILGRIPGIEVTEVDSGCCGMAGSFGYEREHYDLSQKIGEDRLFPAVRTLDRSTTVIASGFSCRHQIEHFTGRHARHWVETLRGREARHVG